MAVAVFEVLLPSVRLYWKIIWSISDPLELFTVKLKVQVPERQVQDVTVVNRGGVPTAAQPVAVDPE